MPEEKSNNFLEEIVEEDLKNGSIKQSSTPFSAEPMDICILVMPPAFAQFRVTQRYGVITNLRFDDTNPTTEERSMWTALRTMSLAGLEWKNELYASDYFPQLYAFALHYKKRPGLRGRFNFGER